MPPLALRCLDTYGRDPSAILAAFGPDKQPAYANSLEAVYRSDTPSLGTLAVAYGPRAAEAWLKLHLFELGEFSGAKEKLNPYQLRALAGTIATNWGYLRLSELMHFFQMFKTGRFGKFYGSVDGLAVTEALGEYTRIRLEHLRQLDNRDRDERRRADDAAHDLAVASLKKQCDAAGLTPGEAGALCRRHGLTISRVCDMAATPEGRKQLGLPDPDNEQPKKRYSTMKPHYPFSGTDLLGTRRTGSLVEHPDGTVFIIEYIRSEPLWFRCKRETIKPEFTTTENPNPES